MPPAWARTFPENFTTNKNRFRRIDTLIDQDYRSRKRSVAVTGYKGRCETPAVSASNVEIHGETPLSLDSAIAIIRHRDILLSRFGELELSLILYIYI